MNKILIIVWFISLFQSIIASDCDWISDLGINHNVLI